MTMAPAKHAAQLMAHIQEGPIRTGWHWLGYNFTPDTAGFFSVGAPTVLALASVDRRMPGYADEQIARLASFGGREKDLGHYQQIISWYAELLIVAQLARHYLLGEATFDMEPVAGAFGFSPEVVVTLEGIGSLGVEVKAPNLLSHSEKRSENPVQFNARSNMAQTLDGSVTLPRDNPVKDFLIHSDQKFAAFRAADPAFRSVLVVVWDDYVNEPLTALSAPGSGLFTSNSFHKESGQPVRYPNVDAVLLVRHQHQFVRSLGGAELVDGRRDLLDYGRREEFPFHALVTNPAGLPMPAGFLDALNAWPIEEIIGAEYTPGGIVMWTD